jgi:hypothetical protein
LPVGVDDRSGPGDDSEPIAVAIEREPQLAIRFCDMPQQLAQVVRLRGVRVMIGKRAIDFAIQLVDVAAEPAQQLR